MLDVCFSMAAQAVFSTVAQGLLLVVSALVLGFVVVLLLAEAYRRAQR